MAVREKFKGKIEDTYILLCLTLKYYIHVFKTDLKLDSNKLKSISFKSGDPFGLYLESSRIERGLSWQMGPRKV